MKTKQMAYDAILTAMCVVLGLVSLDFGKLKITFEDLPILLGAALFGPWDGMIIGVLGTSIYQMLRFGADPTLPLWVIPLMVGGLVAGMLAKRSNYSLEGKDPWITMIRSLDHDDWCRAGDYCAEHRLSDHLQPHLRILHSGIYPGTASSAVRHCHCKGKRICQRNAAGHTGDPQDTEYQHQENRIKKLTDQNMLFWSVFLKNVAYYTVLPPGI